MRVLTKIPVISAAIYAAGDVVGTKLSLGKHDGILRSIHISDDGNQGGACKFLFFDGDPGVVGADNAAFDFAAGALAKLIGVVDSPTFSTVDTKKVGSALNVGLAVKSSDLHVVCVSAGTPTPASVSDLTWKFGIEPNGNSSY